MFAHSKLLRTFVFLFAAATIVLSHAIPSPNAHGAAIQVDEHEHQPVVLESRARGIDRRLLLSTREQDLIFELCKAIERYYERYDYWFFVGNSGGYLAYCFDNQRFKPIPMSGTRKYEMYEHRENDPEGKGVLRNGVDDLIKYYDDLIERKIRGLRINRIMLVDHSSSGRSVEATRLLLVTMFQQKGVWDQFRGVQWGLFNVIDKSKVVNDRIVGVTPPRGFLDPILMVGGEPGHVNKLLGDERRHYRCQADYWPSRWHLDLDTVWTYGNRPAATAIRQQIRNAVRERNNGRLLDPNPTN
ncbi:hypothetical protein CC80DRAFT_541145 [Byssothecium circinans]|uniref:Uncharacterized protein n=1 Tax=Byssothecium circinans TaxID=147558 RepID=A0A6A5T5C4_9PLEO|nr:hypothetical protein CC80DRAFT_541145 [Byssothecium circinans]